MGYRKTGYFEQIFYVIKHKLLAWCEWLDAKAWAKQHHPAWVDFCKRARHESVRQFYRKKILDSYRETQGELYGKNKNR